MTAQLDDLHWIAGAWFRKSEECYEEEVWLEPRGGLMLGLHREMRDGEKPLYEFLRIEESTAGLTYFASLRDEPPIQFSLHTTKPERVEFRRSSPDYPSLVTYWREDDLLCARIEGLHRGCPRAQEWRWQRR